MGQVIVIMGPPGAGKGTQSELLANKLGAFHLSSGEILRQSKDPKVIETLDEGGLAPTDLVCRVVGEAIKQVPASQPIVLDGFTRMLPEAKWLAEFLPTVKRQVNVVVLLKVDQKEAVGRNLLRGREDDDPEAQQKRWELYDQETGPVLDYYRQQGVLKEVNGIGTIEEVAGRVAAAV